MRKHFIAWLREQRHTLVTDPEALATLGLDDAGLAAWAGAERVVTTLPHASPNVFFPRVGVAWYARHLQQEDAELHHVRFALTHVNFSDLGWRPYAWWHLDAGGRLQRSTLFTRNKKRKHVVVASQATLRAVPESMIGVDAAAAELARSGTNLAHSYLLAMAAVERAAGLALPGRTVYLPLSLLVAFARSSGAPWLRELVGSATGRRLGDDGLLYAVADSRTADVLDNDSNLALLAALGEQGVVGGAKMEAYWPQVLARGRRASAASGVRLPAPALVKLPAGVDYAAHVAPSATLAAALDAAGIGYSQGLAVGEHGAFAARSDPFAEGGPGRERGARLDVPDARPGALPERRLEIGQARPALENVLGHGV